MDGYHAITNTFMFTSDSFNKNIQAFCSGKHIFKIRFNTGVLNRYDKNNFAMQLLNTHLCHKKRAWKGKKCCLCSRKSCLLY